MFQLYYYASIPIVTNLLFYSITSLSTSISSSQNVVKFITDHKDCDSIVFKNQLDNIDLENKLRIIESLVYDIIRKFCKDKEEFDKTKKQIQNLEIITSTECDFTLVEFTHKIPVLDKIDEPVKICIVGLSGILMAINEILLDIRKKIIQYEKSYMRNFVSLSLKHELGKLNSQINILDIRTKIMFELLKIYLPLGKNINF